MGMCVNMAVVVLQHLSCISAKYKPNYIIMLQIFIHISENIHMAFTIIIHEVHCLQLQSN